MRCGVLATYYLLTTYSLDTLTRLVESAVGEHMYEGRHGSSAQQQRRTELGYVMGLGVGVGIGVEVSTTDYLLLATDDSPGKVPRPRPPQTSCHHGSRSNRPPARAAARCGPA